MRLEHLAGAQLTPGGELHVAAHRADTVTCSWTAIGQGAHLVTMFLSGRARSFCSNIRTPGRILGCPVSQLFLPWGLQLRLKNSTDKGLFDALRLWDFTNNRSGK